MLCRVNEPSTRSRNYWTRTKMFCHIFFQTTLKGHEKKSSTIPCNDCNSYHNPNKLCNVESITISLLGFFFFVCLSQVTSHFTFRTDTLSTQHSDKTRDVRWYWIWKFCAFYHQLYSNPVFAFPSITMQRASVQSLLYCYLTLYNVCVGEHRRVGADVKKIWVRLSWKQYK